MYPPSSDIRIATKQSFIHEWQTLQGWYSVKGEPARPQRPASFVRSRELRRFEELANEVIDFEALKQFVDDKVAQAGARRALIVRRHTVTLRYLARLLAQRLYQYSPELPTSIEPIEMALSELHDQSNTTGCPVYPCKRKPKQI